MKSQNHYEGSHQEFDVICEKNVQIKIYYPFPIHKMRAYSDMTKKKNLHLPITEKMSKGIFSLPLYPKLKYSEVHKIVKNLKNVVKSI